MEFSETYDQLPRDKDHGPTVLIVDDDRLSRETLQSACSSAIKAAGLRLIVCTGIQEAVEILTETEVHVLLLDKDLGPDPTNPDHNGILAIPHLLSIQKHLQILMVTGSDETDDAVQAMRNGAFDYVVKGTHPELLIEQIKSAVKYAFIAQKEIRASSESPLNGRKTLVGKSEAAQLLRRQIEALAKAETAVLLAGETGTGKTTVAEMIHDLRQIFLKQTNRPFIHLNMAALPEELAERELFGTDKGAYTGAVEAKPGQVELANGGTLFLDEIGDASLNIQAKLLTVLDKGIFRRLGGTHARKSEFRLICATNRDLQQLVKDGLFREDLYMRISTIAIRVPALSERRNDIPEIVRSILPKCCKRSEVYIDFESLPDDLLEYLKETPIQGNIRGLEQQIERLLLFAPRDKKDRPLLNQWRGVPGLQIRSREARKNADTHAITYEEFLNRPLDIVNNPKFGNLDGFLELVMKKLFIDARSKFHFDQEIAAVLDIAPSSVSKRMKLYGLTRKHLRAVLNAKDFQSGTDHSVAATKEGLL